MQPIVLDLDGSVGALPQARRVRLRDRHDALRFACSHRVLRDFAATLDAIMPEAPAASFFGSGDFHHLTLPLVARTAKRCPRPIRLVVFDNHPDNMRFPFAIHCGSWVAAASRLPGVAGIDVVGITSRDIASGHAWENRLLPLYRGRVRYWSIGVDTRWARPIGLASAFRNFDRREDLLAALWREWQCMQEPVYLSIDKDVLDAASARTNWDQGVLLVEDLVSSIERLRGRLVGADINGEVSIARHTQSWKRLLSAIDGQADPDPEAVRAWQAQQHGVNLTLLAALIGG